MTIAGPGPELFRPALEGLVPYEPGKPAELVQRELGLEHVVKVTLYLHDLKYRAAFHEVWMQYWPENPPARIAIRVADANTQEGGNAHFALDVIAIAP